LNETLNRWKARIGSLKGVAAVAILVLMIATAIAARMLLTAIDNPEQPEPITIRQIVEGNIEPGRFVTVEGYAKLDHGYDATENGTVRSCYYYLLDDASRYLVVVKTDPATFQSHLTANTRVSGMTRAVPNELRQLIDSDTPGIRAAGYLTSSTIYLEENARPPERFMMFSTVVVLCASMGIFSLTFLFPSTMFQPMPVDTLRVRDASTPINRTIWARGTFYRLISTEPFIELSGRTRRFRETPVNIKPLPGPQLLIQPLTNEGQHTYSLALGNQSLSFTVGTSPDQWAILVDAQNFIDIDPGKLYGWTDHWAIRLQYSSPGSRKETVILSFENSIAQAECVDRLRELGFLVGMWIA